MRFRIRTNWTNSVSRTHELDDLADAASPLAAFDVDRPAPEVRAVTPDVTAFQPDGADRAVRVQTVRGGIARLRVPDGPGHRVFAVGNDGVGRGR